MSKLNFIDEAIADMNSGIYDFTVDGKCSNCGSCCSDLLPVSQKEIEVIRKYINKHGIKEQKRIFPTAHPTIDFTCPFRSETEKKCTIYAVRPLICRDWQCDKPSKAILADKKLLKEPRFCVSMRAVFFGKNSKSS